MDSTISQTKKIFLEISVDCEIIGKIYINIFEETFPEGVQNFLSLIKGNKTNKTYKGSDFFKLRYNCYIIGGDIYNNNGKTAATIDNKLISENLGELYYTHDTKGILSLIPYCDPETGNRMYDSTFMITLSGPMPELDDQQIVIGQVFGGLDILNKLNYLIKPYAGRKYPKVQISDCNIVK